MQYDVPNSVSLPIGINDTQLAFTRRALMEAARIAGLPMLEQVDFADSILRLPYNQQDRDKLLDVREQAKNKEQTPQFRLLWNSKKDPSPKDGTFEIQDWEFNKRRGKAFGFKLQDSEKLELTRRQIHYQLNGGKLGSGIEASSSDTIIVDLNLIYQKDKYNAATAQNEFGKYVADAVKAYEPLEIKFNIGSWFPGEAKFDFKDNGFLDARITEGSKPKFYNVVFGRRDNTNERISYTTFDSQFKPIASFIFRGAFGDGGAFIDQGLGTHALAHELGHVFGNIGSKVELFGNEFPRIRNYLADKEIDMGIVKLLSGAVKKGVDWKKTGLVLPDASGNVEYVTTFDKIRAGARALAGMI